MFRNLKKHIAIFFLVLISLLIVPKEFIHSLTGHEDTICFWHNGKTLEKPHHHCGILNFNAPLFLVASSFQLPVSSLHFQLHFLNDYSCCFSDFINLSYLRAPPFTVNSEL